MALISVYIFWLFVCFHHKIQNEQQLNSTVDWHKKNSICSIDSEKEKEKKRNTNSHGANGQWVLFDLEVNFIQITLLFNIITKSSTHAFDVGKVQSINWKITLTPTAQQQQQILHQQWQIKKFDLSLFFNYSMPNKWLHYLKARKNIVPINGTSEMHWIQSQQQ